MFCVLSIVNKLSKVMPYMMPKQLTLIFDEFEINSKFPTDSHEKGQILFFLSFKNRQMTWCSVKKSIIIASKIRPFEHNFRFRIPIIFQIQL